MSKDKKDKKIETKNNSVRKILSRKIIILISLGIIILLGTTYLIIKMNSTNPTTSERSSKHQRVSKNKDVRSKKVKTTIEDKDYSQNLKIEELQEKFNNLEITLDAIKLNDKLSRIILSFAELRSLIELEENYQIKLQEFSTLAAADPILNLKSEELSTILNNRNYQIQDIRDEFENTIDKIIALKSQDENKNGLIDKLQHSFSKLVIIRRVDGKIQKSGDEIDLAILEIKELIRQKSHQKALDNIKTFGPKYQKELARLSEMLTNQADLDKVSEEIFAYLKKVTKS